MERITIKKYRVPGQGLKVYILQCLNKLCYSDTEAEALKLSKDAKYYKETSNTKTVVSL